MVEILANGVREIGNLQNDLKRGIFISAIGRYAYLIIQFVIMAVLSRLLTPEEFGIVSIINVFLIFFNMLVDMGIGPAIIQNKTLNQEQINGIFSFTIILSIVISILFALLAKPIALFYHNPDLVGVGFAMSIALLSTGFNMVPQAILAKQKKFLDINVAQVISSIVAGVIAIVLAYHKFSYYALVINAIVKNTLMFFIIFIRSQLKLTKEIHKSSLMEIYTFSRNQFIFNLINYFSRNLDHLLIGKFISTKALGYYDKAYTLSLYPNQILISVITPVVQPVLSEYEDQKQVIKKTYLTLSKLLALVGMPLTIFLIFSAKEIIYILFGNQWGNSVITFQILAASIWIQMILSSTGSIFQSANRTDLLLLSGILSSVLNVISIAIGVVMGSIEVVAFGLVITFSINFIQCNYLLLVKVFQAKQLEFYRVLKGPVLIALLVLIPLVIIEWMIPDVSNLFSLGMKGLVSLALYLTGLKISGNFNYLLSILKRKGSGSA